MMKVSAMLGDMGSVAISPEPIRENTRCTCGKPVRDCEVWREVVRVIGEDRNIDIMSNPYAFDLGYFNAVVIRDTRKHSKVNRLLERLQ
jgi:hypothetical protein